VDEEAPVAVAEPVVRPKRSAKQKAKDPPRQPRYHVILWNDDDHSYDYVVRMMKELFGHPDEAGYKIAKTVDSEGRAICLTTTLEHAELKRDQIHAFGKDAHIERCLGSMKASIEPETGS
jgi:ATP-dependent Clp protease adaptor protein ClpS